jgi:hypothetical protein
MTFDVRHIRSIRYTNTMGADVKLAEDLGNALVALGYRGERKDPWGDEANDERSKSTQGSVTEKNPRSRRRKNQRDDHNSEARRTRKASEKKT